MENAEAQRAAASQRVTLIGGLTNILLGIFKIVAGMFGHSHALIADGFHSLADLVTDALVLFAAKFGAQDADQDHPYGHGRIETLATGFIALLLVFTGVGIIYDAALHLSKPAAPVPVFYVFIVAILSILAKEILFQYTRQLADSLSSELLRANAWHHRSDAFSSIVVLIGLIGVMLGFTYLDAIAAIVVGLMVMHMGWELGGNSMRELIDTAVNEETLNSIQKTILNIDGVRAVHQLRTRSMRGNVLVDVHVMVDPHLSVSEGHHISEQVYVALNKVHSDITDVTVHIDPEDDEVAAPSLHLPSRESLMPTLNAAWASLPLFQSIEKVTLHYLSGKIDIDIYLPFEEDYTKKSLEALQTQFRQAVNEESVGLIKVILI